MLQMEQYNLVRTRSFGVYLETSNVMLPTEQFTSALKYATIIFISVFNFFI